MSGSSAAEEGWGQGGGLGQPTPTPHSAFSHFCFLRPSTDQELVGTQGEGEGKPAFVQHQALEICLDFEVITYTEECIKHVYTVL